ncbi:MAG TPA: hypothetical protein VHU91_04510 [Mycobacteriales bacterium]|jgi:hypothetical protein|nr:hypothetical protein [Mycobacteriales bacterium]
MSRALLGARDSSLSWLDRAFVERYRVPMVVTTATSMLLCVGFLLLPLAGTDLSAQVARGHFFQEHGPRPIDFRWYGGTHPFGYSVLTGPMNALLGSRGVGAVSCVLSASAFAWLLTRLRVRRPAWAGVMGALLGMFNLVSGRTTFAMGVAFAILALCALVIPKPGLIWRLVLAGVLGVLAGAASPVAGAFIGLAGLSLLLAGVWRQGVALAVGAGIGLVPAALLFRDGGEQPYSLDTMKVALAVCVVTFFLVPARYLPLRIGVVLTATVLVSAVYEPNALGSNAGRLPLLFAAPLVVAVSTLDRRWLAAVIAVMFWWQPPLIAGDLNSAGSDDAKRLFYQPLIKELGHREPIGRIEVVPLANHWESTYVADKVPIARGWLRQVDVDRNGLFYNGTLDPGSYLEWLYRNAVEYVAVPRGVHLDGAGREETSLISADLTYLEPAWNNSDWTLYHVIGGRTLVDYPAKLVSSNATGVRFTVSGPTTILVRVVWSRWLALEGGKGCIEPGPDRWVRVHLKRRGAYHLTSSLSLIQGSHC